MKKLAVFVVVAIAGLVAFNYATTGELKLTPSFSKSDEGRAVADLQERLSAARKRFTQAHRSAAVGGIDTSGDAEAAINSVKGVKRDLDKLRKTLSEDKAKRKAKELADAVLACEKAL